MGVVLAFTRRYPDGSVVYPSGRIVGKWQACWAYGTPLRGDGDFVSFFASAHEAVQALAEGGEGPAVKEAT